MLIDGLRSDDRAAVKEANRIIEASSNAVLAKLKPVDAEDP
jgi:hypothetical protein